MPVVQSEVDCPECKGPGTAIKDIDLASNTPLGLHCRICDFAISYADASDDTPSEVAATADLNPSNPARPENATHTTTAGSAAAARRNAEKATRKSTLHEHLSRRETEGLTDENFPHHTGAGWYLLTNGAKVRGKEKAIASQLSLTPSLEHLQQYVTSDTTTTTTTTDDE